MKQLPAAVRSYRQAIKVERQSYPAHEKLAWIRLYMEEEELAVKSFCHSSSVCKTPGSTKYRGLLFQMGNGIAADAAVERSWGCLLRWHQIERQEQQYQLTIALKQRHLLFQS